MENPLREKVVELVFDELRRAEAKFPGWPDDPVHGAAIVAEESGELTQAALDVFYGRESELDKMLKEAAQTAAVAFRMAIWIMDVKAGRESIMKLEGKS